MGKRNAARRACLFFVLVLLLAGVQRLRAAAGHADFSFFRFSPLETTRTYKGCTQIYFHAGCEFIVEKTTSSILYRSQGEKRFARLGLSLDSPHAIAFNPSDNLYYVADTGNNSIIAFPSPDSPQPVFSTAAIAGHRLIRPHDIVVDNTTGWIYSLNPTSTKVFRFKGIGDQEHFLDLSGWLDYARALSIIQGRLFVVGSSKGIIVEVTDFDRGTFILHRSAGKRKIAASGCWEETGLIPNDIEFFHGYWYVSSYFSPATSRYGWDYNKNKFIRFRTWKEFEAGTWEDLSEFLPDGLVPYFLTVHRDRLYLSLFNHQMPGNGDAIYCLTTTHPLAVSRVRQQP